MELTNTQIFDKADTKSFKYPYLKKKKSKFTPKISKRISRLSGNYWKKFSLLVKILKQP